MSLSLLIRGIDHRLLDRGARRPDRGALHPPHPGGRPRGRARDGAGAATADAIYGCLAAFGLTALTGALVGAQTWIRLIGGAFLLYLGVRTFLAQPSETAAAASRASGLLSAYASTFVLTLTNP